jgi:hypothetical protein
MGNGGKAGREWRAETTAEREIYPLRIARTRRNHHRRLSLPAQPMVEKQRCGAKARSKPAGQKTPHAPGQPGGLPFG